MTAHRIGIIAGSGPEAGIDMWQKVLEEHRSFLGASYFGDTDAPEVTVVSLPELGYSMELELHEERVWAALADAAGRIAPHVDVYVIACNTLNYFAPRLRDLDLPAVLLTPAEVVMTELASRGTSSVALLGSRQTMDLDGWSSYAALQDQVKVEMPDDLERLHALIHGIKVSGGATKKHEAEFAAIRANLKNSTVLLACTELPLLRGPAASEANGAIDVSRLLARAAVRWEPTTAPALRVVADAGVRASMEASVAVLYTGGTFGMVQSGHGLVPSPDLRERIEELVGPVGANDGAQWTYDATPQAIDSAEASYDSFAQLADQIRAVISARQPDAVVVIHGTDSMAYSAAFAAFALADLDIPIIFTGSQFPLGFPSSDASANFADALLHARRLRVAGVQIVFGGQCLPAVRATKRSAVDYEAFAASRPSAPGATGIETGLARELQAATGRAAPNATLVKVTPGLTADQVTAAAAGAGSGVVLETYGAGTAPVESAELSVALREATAAGTPVIAITQCGHGSVDLGRYAVGALLAESAVLSGADMTAEAALGKLVALTRAGISGDRLLVLLGTNLIGEVSAG